MNVPFTWLKDFVAIDITPQELAHRLTMAGLEAEKLIRIGEGWDNVFVGEVMSVVQHPDADRLVLADVAAGEHRLTVVTGAPNIRQGQKVALALAGAKLIDAYAEVKKLKTLKPGKIRGIQSDGMVCSEKELGLSDEHEGILVLSADAPAGLPVSDWLGDTVIEFEITPNLVHAFSMLGIARETSALLNQPLHEPALAKLTTVPRSESLITVANPELCPRYAGIVIDGITIGPSPPWMVERLAAAGVRSINNVVDITNYVMLEYGQPTHAFDLDFITSGRILIRTASASEPIETLDHIRRTIPEGGLVITDDGRPIGIAGIMGGANSEVLETTTSIVLEVANFDMVSVRQTARAIKLRTDASTRYERGLDPELVSSASRRAVRLILDICPGANVRTMQDVYPSPPLRRTVDLPLNKVGKLLGMEIPVAQLLGALTRLGFHPALLDGDVLQSEIPSWRSDVTIPEDIIEEIARIVGYEQLPATHLSGTIPAVIRDAGYVFDRDLRRLLIENGLFEARGYVTNAETQLNAWGLKPSGEGFGLDLAGAEFVRLRNAIPASDNILRPSTVPNLVKSVVDNLKHERSVRLFEIGHCFVQRQPDQLPDEPTTMAIAMAGARFPFDRFTQRDVEQLDYTDAKGVIDRVLQHFGCSDASFIPLAHPALHPGRSAGIRIGGTHLGVIAEVHPRLARSLGIDHLRLVIAELNVSSLREVVEGRPIAPVVVQRFQPVEQDFAIIVPAVTPATDVERALRSGAGPLVTNVVLFDVFEGEQIGIDRKSLAYRVTFTAPDRALTDAELGKVRSKIERTLAKQVEGTLRS